MEQNPQLIQKPLALAKANPEMPKNRFESNNKNKSQNKKMKKE
jgi:hypothetical protein